MINKKLTKNVMEWVKAHPEIHPLLKTATSEDEWHKLLLKAGIFSESSDISVNYIRDIYTARKDVLAHFEKKALKIEKETPQKSVPILEDQMPSLINAINYLAAAINEQTMTFKKVKGV